MNSKLQTLPFRVFVLWFLYLASLHAGINDAKRNSINFCRYTSKKIQLRTFVNVVILDIMHERTFFVHLLFDVVLLKWNNQSYQGIIRNIFLTICGNHTPKINVIPGWGLGALVWSRADSRFVPSQWETVLQSNAVSHWLGANIESALWSTLAKYGYLSCW